jgi:hypothetical protein
LIPLELLAEKSLLSFHFMVYRFLLLEICVLYAKKRCMLPSSCSVNISSAKTVLLNGMAYTFGLIPTQLSSNNNQIETLVIDGRLERERTCPLCRALVKPGDIRSFSDGSTTLFFQLF